MTKWDLSQVLESWFSAQSSMSIIHHISKAKEEKPTDHINRCRKSI